MSQPMRHSYGAALFVVGLSVVAGCGGADRPLGEVATLVESGASNPTVATSPDGGAYVAWIGSEGHRSDVWLGHVSGHGDVSEAVRVNDVEGDGAPHLQAPAQVALGPEGNVYVAWTNNVVVEGRQFPTSDLRFARSTDGGRTFSAAITVNDDTDGPASSHTFHNLTVAPDGTVIVSWLDNRRGEMAQADANQRRVGVPEAEPDIDPAIPGPDARVAYSTDGGQTFSSNIVVDQMTCPCCRTSMAVADDGTLYLAWRKIFEGDVRDIVVARSHDLGATWGAPKRVAADDWVFPGCPHAGPSLTVDRAGTLHVAWYTGQEDGPGLYYTRSEDRAETFADPVPLLTDAWVPPSQVSLAADASGRLHIVWEDLRSDEPGFFYATSGAGAPDPSRGEWHAGTNPQLTGSDDNVALAWLDGDAVRVRTSSGGRQ
jgi:hypothetical protein